MNDALKQILIVIALLFTVPLSVSADTGQQLDDPQLVDDGFSDDEFADDEFLDDDEFAEDEFDIETAEIWDPLEPVNRGIFWFNDRAYRYVLKPVARGFRIVPRPIRRSASNFFTNIATPIRFVNSLLQLKFKKAGTEAARFAINTTIGIGGLFDPAANQFNIQRHNEDLGQTFGRYGAGHGFYIVLPILGPSSLRDGAGRIGDAFLDPVVVTLDDEDTVAAKVFDTINDLSLDNDTYEALTDDAIDPYLTVRDAYTQLRERSVAE